MPSIIISHNNAECVLHNNVYFSVIGKKMYSMHLAHCRPSLNEDYYFLLSEREPEAQRSASNNNTARIQVLTELKS